MTKGEARAFAKNARAGMTDEEAASLSKAVWSRLRELPAYAEAQTVFCYLSAGKEVDTLSGVTEMLAQGKRVFVPRVECRGQMSAVEIKSLSGLMKNRFGILEPQLTVFAADKRGIALALLPGLAFDRVTLHRAGYGGGYYDRFLAGFDGLKIGLCFERQLVDKLDYEDTDVPADAVVTEREIRFRGK